MAQSYAQVLLRMNRLQTSKVLGKVKLFALRSGLSCLIKRGGPGFIFAEGPQGNVLEFRSNLARFAATPGPKNTCDCLAAKGGGDTRLQWMGAAEGKQVVKVVVEMEQWEQDLTRYGLQEWAKKAIPGRDLDESPTADTEEGSQVPNVGSPWGRVEQEVITGDENPYSLGVDPKGSHMRGAASGEMGTMPVWRSIETTTKRGAGERRKQQPTGFRWIRDLRERETPT